MNRSWKAKGKTKLKRAKGKDHVKKKVLLVCEGLKTEKKYFEFLIKKLGVDTNLINVIGTGNEPRGLLRIATKEARTLIYKTIYCIFDRDEHENFDFANSEIERLNASSEFDANMSSINSYPCFEFWFLLHFSSNRTYFLKTEKHTASQLAVKEPEKKKGFKDYSKAIEEKHLKLLYPKLDDAINNAIDVEREANKDENPNPSSQVYKVVELLKSL